MLELRPCCENCAKPLPFDAGDAMICSFECTFCSSCTATVLEGICPNCGGNLEKRPIRPRSKIEKYPPSQALRHQPIDVVKQSALVHALKNVPPKLR